MAKKMETIDKLYRLVSDKLWKRYNETSMGLTFSYTVTVAATPQGFPLVTAVKPLFTATLTSVFIKAYKMRGGNHIIMDKWGMFIQGGGGAAPIVKRTSIGYTLGAGIGEGYTAPELMSSFDRCEMDLKDCNLVMSNSASYNYSLQFWDSNFLVGDIIAGYVLLNFKEYPL